MSKLKVAVLGCGPAGLMTVHAAKQRNCDVKVFSHKALSPMSGAQYLHEPIPGINSPGGYGTIHYGKVGTAEVYAEKVYGAADAPTSWEVFPGGPHKAWSLRETYLELVRRYWDLVQQAFIEPGDVEELCRDYDMVYSTVPAKKLCKNPVHAFEAQEVCIVPGVPEGWPMSQTEALVVYNGLDEDDWYRTSRIFGTEWTEYSRHRVPHSKLTLPEAQRGLKPLKTDCSCHSLLDNFVRLGRFGQWRKAVLTSDAYKYARASLDAALEGENVHAL